MKIFAGMSERNKKLILALLIPVIVVIFSQEYFFTFGPLHDLEQSHVDERFQNRGPRNIKDSSNVIVLELTQATYQQIPQSWPWPRSVYARVIRNLNRAGVKAIGIDVVMSSPDQHAAANDSDMVNAIREKRNVVVAGEIVSHEGKGTTTSMGNGTNAEIQSFSYTVTQKDENFQNVYYKADSSIGIVEVIPDEDGVIRRYYPARVAPTIEKTVPTFSFAVLNKYFGLPADHIIGKDNGNFLLNDRVIPKFDRSSMLINYYGPSRSFRYVDFWQVLDDNEFKTKDELELGIDINTWDDTTAEVDSLKGLLYQGIFKDKIVLIGSSIPEDKDIMAVSFSSGEKKGDNLMYGVEVHANTIQNILWSDFITKEPKYVEIILIFLLALLAFYSSSMLKEIKSKYSVLLEIGVIFLIGVFVIMFRQFSFYMFREHNILLTILSPNIALFFGYIGSTAYHFLTERKQKGMIKGMFSQYVSGSVVDDLIAHPDRLKLGGERKNLTVFFSDIAGFSTFSENKEPEDLVTFLNEYLSEMTRIVFESDGTLDKYVGDAIMAFWGAPAPNSDHAAFACRSAIAMQKRLAELQAKWKAEGQPLIHARMGINTGDMVVGNVGGHQRFDYTVMGDNVNVASRLEGANKEYGTAIMISESTFQAVGDAFITRELDMLVVKGRTQPMKVYELIAEKGEQLPAETVDIISRFSEALALFRKTRFPEAKDMFTRLVADYSDYTSKTYVKRCDFYISNPPPSDWDGVFHMTTK